jgi:hypothetical protein
LVLAWLSVCVGGWEVGGRPVAVEGNQGAPHARWREVGRFYYLEKPRALQTKRRKKRIHFFSAREKQGTEREKSNLFQSGAKIQFGGEGKGAKNNPAIFSRQEGPQFIFLELLCRQATREKKRFPNVRTETWREEKCGCFFTRGNISD